MVIRRKQLRDIDRASVILKTISINVPNITKYNYDEVIKLIVGLTGSVKNASKSEVTLDIQEVQFVDPCGMVCLWGVCRYLKDRYRKIMVVLPKSLDLQCYLNRMKLYDMLDPLVAFENKHYLSASHSMDQSSDVLLELTPIRRQNDIKGVIKEVLSRVETILAKQLSYDDKYISHITTTLSELCQNIFDHSEDEGVACVQRYTSRDGTRYVIIGVADYGIGIRESLAKRNLEAINWRHEVAIAKALLKEYSRHPHRGLGLYFVSKIVKEYRGSLNIRSGDAQFYFRSGFRNFETVDFPGTHVGISLSEKEGA